MKPRLHRVICRIDELNRKDPNTVSVSRSPLPAEFAYAQRLTAWVKRLNPQASEWLLIAARGQHVQRWTLPRSEYPEGRAGYLKWRETLKRMHAQLVCELLAEEGYSEAERAQVEAIILKKDLSNPDTQTMEDALCLVFLEFQLEELMTKTVPEKMPAIIQKTWRKMSERGRQAALQLEYSEPAHALLQNALRQLKASE